MTRITRSADCGNSPKNAMVEQLAIGLEGGDWRGEVANDATAWNMADGTRVVGSDAILSSRASAPQSIRVDHVATHGKVGTASGAADGEAFAHIFTFTSASARQLASIDSFRKTEKKHG